MHEGWYTQHFPDFYWLHFLTPFIILLFSKYVLRATLCEVVFTNKHCIAKISQTTYISGVRMHKYTSLILRKLTVCAQSLGHVRLFATPRTAAHQAPLSMGFSRQEYWSGLPFLSPGYLPKAGMKHVSPVSPALQEDSLPLSHWGSP